MQSSGDFLSAYCYGPADILDIFREGDTLWLRYLDPLGRQRRALYRGCVYGPPDRSRTGQHLSMVVQVEPRELEAPGLSGILLPDPTPGGQQLHSWKQQGYCCFLHIGTGPGRDFLVVADRLELL